MYKVFPSLWKLTHLYLHIRRAGMDIVESWFLVSSVATVIVFCCYCHYCVR